jgi:hypothetical protein
MIMTAVESLLAVVRQKQRERERRDLTTTKRRRRRRRREEKMPANDEMCESANTHIRPVRQQIILQ